MEVAIVLGVVFCVGMGVFTVRDEMRRRAMLEQLARDLGGVAHEDKNEVSATLDGVPVRFAFVQRGASESRYWCTDVECTLPPAYPLDLHVRRHDRSDEGQIARGTMVDVQLGEPRFDATFLVEAAPADVVRQLLDQDFRTFMVSVPGELTSMHEGPERIFRLSVVGRIEDLGEARRHLDMLARLAARVPGAFMQADAAIPTESIGSPFRAIVDTSAQREAGQARVAEVERLTALRSKRVNQTSWLTIAIAVVLGVAILYLRWMGR